MTEVSLELYAGLQAFFRAHPGLQRRPFFAAGESFAGKFVPCLGARPDRPLMDAHVWTSLPACSSAAAEGQHSALCGLVACVLRELLRIAAAAVGSNHRFSCKMVLSSACGILSEAACSTCVSGTRARRMGL